MSEEIEKKTEIKQKSNNWREIINVIITSALIVLPIRYFIAQPFVVSGASMDNTFQNGNYLIIDELSYRFKNPERGDVVVFKTPPEALEIQNVDPTKTVHYIKRIIGLPGETIEISGDSVKIFNTENPDGFVLDEKYVYINKNVKSIFSEIHKKITLGADEYFVMGDNRHNSSDSRIWGPLKKNFITGRAFLRLLPINEIGVFPGRVNI